MSNFLYRHLSSPTAPWRHNALLLALSGMEIAWITPFVLAFHPRGWQAHPLLYLLGLWGIMLVMMAVGSYLTDLQLAPPVFGLGALATILGRALLILRLYVFWGTPAFDLSWIHRAFLEPGPDFGTTMLLLVTLLYLWGRGISFLRRDVDDLTIGRDFRKGIIGLAIGLSLFTYTSGQQDIFVVYPFFFFSLITIALERIEGKIYASSNIA